MPYYATFIDADTGKQDFYSLRMPNGKEYVGAKNLGNEVNFLTNAILHEWGHGEGMYTFFEHPYYVGDPVGSARKGLIGNPGTIMDPGGAMRNVGAREFDERDLNFLRDKGYLE